MFVYQAVNIDKCVKIRGKSIKSVKKKNNNNKVTINRKLLNIFMFCQ